MCGIAGIWDPMQASAYSPDALEQRARRMSHSIRHRGPDAEGVWTCDNRRIAMSHARLAIIDLSATGSQPMRSHDGRWVIAFNGEIYNHREIRNSLASRGVTFRGTSDTEVLLESIATLGIEPTLGMLVGMYAFSVWDRSQN